MSDERAERIPWGPAAWIFNGFLIAFVGGILFGVGVDQSIDGLTFAGYAVGFVGSVMFAIGVIAKGVQAGNEASRWPQ